MFAGIAGAARMAREEAARTAPYDVVLYFRADAHLRAPLWPHLAAAAREREDDAVWVPDDFDWGGINDQCAWGAPAAMARYAAAYERITARMRAAMAASPARAPPLPNPELELAQHLQAAGLRLHRVRLPYQLDAGRGHPGAPAVPDSVPGVP
jgi:hypothetical protein